MIRALSFCIILLSATVACHHDDPSINLCVPHALKTENDSVVYAYVGGHVKTASYYAGGRMNAVAEFSYNKSAQLISVTKSNIIDGDDYIDSYNALSYGTDGRPTLLETTQSGSQTLRTRFTHNTSGQLVKAETLYTGFSLGITRYEYDANGNIPKVYYTVYINNEKTEVLARENLSFDDKEKFYVNSPDLKLLNEYVYGYLPTKNNCLSSTVYYHSYEQRFTSPQSVTFTSTYNDDGLITSLISEGTSTQLYSGEVLFNKVVYSCN